MNATIQTIEDSIRARLVSKITYMDTTRIITVPPELDIDDIDNTLLPKGVEMILIAFEGLDKDPGTDERDPAHNIWRETYQWFLFLVAVSFRSREQQIRGGTTTRGAYDMIFDATTALDGYVPVTNMDPIDVMRVRLARKRANSVIYKLDFVTGQDRSSDLTPCGLIDV